MLCRSWPVVGDTVSIHFKNNKSSRMIHSIGFHAVTGLGDGANLFQVPPGGATAVEFTPEVPGNYILVDHALSRAELGLTGVLQVSGKEGSDIYKGDGPMSHVGH